MTDEKFMKFVTNEHIEKSEAHFLSGMGTSLYECQEIWGEQESFRKKKKKTQNKKQLFLHIWCAEKQIPPKPLFPKGQELPKGFFSL